MSTLTRLGMSEAFPIQQATIADALAGRDVLGKARTGSGKTLAFGLPALTMLADSGRAKPHRPRAVVLVPTRELAMQVNDALEPFAHALHVSLRLVAGGLSMSKQIAALERGVHLVVATPGRLADLQRRGHADLADCRLVVLDEADHMAEMGFMTEITALLEHVPADGQRLLFSATLDGDVDTLVRTYMRSPVIHDVTDASDQQSADMTHTVFHVPPHAKYQTATRIASRDGRTIVFVRTKLGCERIADQMRQAGVSALALHGDKTQNERNSAITAFRAGRVPVLVATDVAARGIHVDGVDLVLMVDPPADHKDYTHRAGRTARAGARGQVVTLALAHQRRGFESLLERAGIDATTHRLAGNASDEELVDRLTGARPPSGVPVRSPRASKPERDNRSPRGARPTRSPSGPRTSRPTRSARPERGDARPAPERRERPLERKNPDRRERVPAPRTSESKPGGVPQRDKQTAPPVKKKNQAPAKSSRRGKPRPKKKR